MWWEEIIIGSFTTYILTLLIVEGAMFDTTRRWLRPRTLFLIIGNKWFLDCYFCVAFWTSLVVMLLIGNLSMTLVTWGISYWIFKIERR